MNPKNRRSFLSTCALGTAGAAGALGLRARAALLSRDFIDIPSPFSDVHRIVIPETPTLAVQEVSVPGPTRSLDSVTVEAVANGRFSVSATTTNPDPSSFFCQGNIHSEFRTPNRPSGLIYGHVDVGAAVLGLGSANNSITLNFNGALNRSSRFTFNAAVPNGNRYFRDNYLVNGRFPFLFVAWSDFHLGGLPIWTLTRKMAYTTSTLTVTYNYTPMLSL